MDDDHISRIEAALKAMPAPPAVENGPTYYSSAPRSATLRSDDIRALLDRLKAAEAENERMRDALEAVVAYRTGGLIERLCREALENTNAK